MTDLTHQNLQLECWYTEEAKNFIALLIRNNIDYDLAVALMEQVIPESERYITDGMTEQLVWS